MNPYLNSILEQEIDVMNVSLDGETLAYTWFGRPNAVASDSEQKYWIGTTKDTPSGTTQHVTEFNNVTKKYTTTQVGTVFQKDDHNQTQILIRENDKRLLAFYVEHNGNAIRWKISNNPLDASSWGIQKSVNPVFAYSYISPYQASNGDIFIFFRANSNPAVWYFMKSIDNGETFSGLTELYNNGSTQAYLISFQEGDKIHFSASNGHPQHQTPANINVYHFYLDLLTETAHATNDSALTLPLNPASITPVYLASGTDTTWILDGTIKNEKPRLIFAFYPNGTQNNLLNKELYFSEWDGNVWTNAVKIADTMSGYIETDATVQERGYTGASRFDTKNPDIIWMPKEVENENGDLVLEIHKVDLRTNPIYIEQLTFNSEVDNWRPISVPSTVNNLLWLKNNSYEMYNDYSITLQAKTVNTIKQ